MELELIRGTWNAAEKLDAWAKASLEGNREEEQRVNAEIRARGAKKPRLAVVGAPEKEPEPVTNFGILLNLIADGRFAAARKLMDELKDDPDDVSCEFEGAGFLYESLAMLGDEE